MRLITLVLAGLLVTPTLFADDHNIDFDPQTDFSTLKTFTIREGQITAQKPELSGPLVRKLVQTQPDVVVTFRLGADWREVDSFPAGRFGRGRRTETVRFTEGTLVINLLERTGRELVWRGIYHDDES